MTGVSGERIWTELRKILAGKMAGAIVKTMVELGMGEYIGKTFICVSSIKLYIYIFCG